MPKGKNRKLNPPFELNLGALNEWWALQDEVGGTFRGLGLSEQKIWKLAVIAEHSHDWRRRRIADKYLFTLREYRAELGLPELPPPLPAVERKAA